MNMIPSVMANEPGKAQLANRKFRLLNCSLDKRRQWLAGRKSFWKNAPQRVRVPCAVRTQPRSVALFRVAHFGSGAQKGR
jgi:hypothetical protein